MPDTIGRRIAQRRKMLSLSQEALGEKMGVSRQAISKWEADASIPEVDRLIEMGKLFGVSVDWLLSGDETGLPEEGPDLTETITQTLCSPVAPEPQAEPTPEPAPVSETPVKAKKRPWLKIACIALTTASLIMSTLSLLRPVTDTAAPQTADASVLERIDTLETQKVTLMVRITELERELSILESKIGPTISNEDPNGKTTHISITDWDLTAEAMEDLSKIALRLTFLPAVDLTSATFNYTNGTSTTQSSCKQEGNYYIANAYVPPLDGYQYDLTLTYADGTKERISLKGHGLSELATMMRPTVSCTPAGLVEGQSTMDRFWISFNRVSLKAPLLADPDATFQWSDLKITCYIGEEKVLEKDLETDYKNVLTGISLDKDYLSLSLPSVRYDVGKFVNGDTIQMRIEGKLTINATAHDFSLPLITWKVLSNTFVEQGT